MKFAHSMAAAATALVVALSPTAFAADYKIDDTHSFIQFRIQHLGMSWLYGRFNKFSGDFSHDASNPGGNSIALQIDTTSVDTNHSKRDDHLRSADFLDVANHPTASFKSTGYTGSDAEGVLSGDLTLMGVTKPIKINMTKMGAGKDPWGGERAGFEGSTVINRQDFGMAKSLGPKGWELEMTLGVEGIKQ